MHCHQVTFFLTKTKLRLAVWGTHIPAPALRIELAFICAKVSSTSLGELSSIFSRYLFSRFGIQCMLLRNKTNTKVLSKPKQPRQFDETSVFGRTEIIYECAHFGIYILEINPGQEIPCHVHLTTQESELLLTTLAVNGQTIQKGYYFDWPLNCPHSYQNISMNVGKVLCIDRPKFDSADERFRPATQCHKIPEEIRQGMWVPSQSD